MSGPFRSEQLTPEEQLGRLRAENDACAAIVTALEDERALRAKVRGHGRATSLAVLALLAGLAAAAIGIVAARFHPLAEREETSRWAREERERSGLVADIGQCRSDLATAKQDRGACSEGAR